MIILSYDQLLYFNDTLIIHYCQLNVLINTFLFWIQNYRELQNNIFGSFPQHPAIIIYESPRFTAYKEKTPTRIIIPVGVNNLNNI